MSFEGLLSQTVTLLFHGEPDRDAVGGTSPTNATTLASAAYLQPVAQNEDMAERNTQIGDWLLILPAQTPLTGWDRFSDEDGRIFSILGPPARMRSPRAGEHHVEVHGRLVE